MTIAAVDWNIDNSPQVCGLPPFGAMTPSPSLLREILPCSSIRRADLGNRLPHHRPRLEPPGSSYLFDLLDMHQKVELAVSKELSLLKVQSNIDLSQIESLEKEKENALRKHAAEAAARNTWSVLGVVAQYLTTGASIIIGASIGPASWAGGLLLASGIVGAGNRVIQDTGGWQAVIAWFTKSVELQKTYAKKMETFAMYFELGAGLAGGAHGCWTGASAIASIGKKTVMNTVASSVQLASSTLKATSKLGKNCFEKRMNDLQGRMRILDAQAERTRMEMSRQVDDAKNLLETTQTIDNEMQKAIEASEIHN